MVFSTLFGGKKRDKDQSEPQVAKPASPGARPAAPPSPAPVEAPAPSEASKGSLGLSTTVPLTTSGSPRSAPQGNARELARATAEKIDKIESEMTLDYTPTPRPAAPPSAPAAAVSAPAASPAPPAGLPPIPYTPSSTTTTQARKRGRRADGTSTTLPSLGQTTDILLGDSILANAMELTDSASSPAIEEAAILYANGQPLPAVAVLADALKSDGSGAGNSQAWMMLFELYEVLGKRAEFENLAIDYAVRFETSAPTWTGTGVQRAAPPKAVAPAAARATVAFSGGLNSTIVPQLDQLKRLAQKNQVLYLEFDKVTSADSSGADLILRVFAAFQKSNHEVVIEGAEHLADRLLASLEVGRRDPSNASWMLLLEVYRILGRQAAFEETSIDYCVTYEVSPPSWEPPSAKFRVGSGASAPREEAPSAVEPASEVPTDSIGLSGDLLGKAESDLQRLTQYAAEHRKVIVDCKGLRRLDFTAAGVLLNWAVSMQAANKTVELRQVSNLVAALLVVMGLDEIAQIERRKL